MLPYSQEDTLTHYMRLTFAFSPAAPIKISLYAYKKVIIP